MNVNVRSTKWSLKQIAHSFSEDENYIFIAKFAKTALIILVTNTWHERGASTVKGVKTRIRSTMKNDLLNGLLHILINGPTSHSNEAKVVATRAVEKYDSSQRHHRPNKPCAVMPSNPSVAVQVDLSQHNLLNQMESCTEQLHEKGYVMQTHSIYECSSDESESDMGGDFECYCCFV